jgi:hypothetical protein
LKSICSVLIREVPPARIFAKVWATAGIMRLGWRQYSI